MTSVSQFVRGTLTYIANCLVALFTLFWSALACRPIKGAIRCKVRYDFHQDEYPDSRVLLFLGSCVFGVICSFAFRGVLVTLAELARLIAGSVSIPKEALVAAVLTYFVCEFTIGRETSRRVMPGRRGKRNRQILRMMLAALLLEISVYEPIALTLINKLPTTWMNEPLYESSLGQAFFFLVSGAIFLVLFAPFAHLFIALGRSRALRATGSSNYRQKKSRELERLPLNLLGVLIAAGVVMHVLYSPPTPKMVSLQCTTLFGPAPKAAGDGAGQDYVLVQATFVNDGEAYWEPARKLELNILGAPRTNPWTNVTDTRVTGSNLWTPPQSGEGPSVLLIPPHTTINFVRRAIFEKNYLNPRGETGCSLSNGEAQSGLSISELLDKRRLDERLDWVEIHPADFRTGHLIF